MPGKTRYMNTDLELWSKTKIDVLCEEFERTCSILHHQLCENSEWYACIESESVDNQQATDDIQKILAVLPTLSETAKQQWEDCHTRDFNIGFECGETRSVTVHG